MHKARGSGRLGDYAPYVAASVRAALQNRSPAGLTGVDEIVIGSFRIAAFSNLEDPRVRVNVEFEANYTERTATAAARWYVREQWVLLRARDILSPAPEDARAEHCPKCGAALETRTDGACLHCGTVIADGTFQWFVVSITTVARDARPRNLGGAGDAECGRSETVVQPMFERRRAELLQRDPAFDWKAFVERVTTVARELQTAWTSRNWQHARHYETGALFQMHRYWIDEYLRQGLRNVVDDFAVREIVWVKVTSDAFYDAITVRLYASGADYTVDDAGTVVSGSHYPRHWSEYWTFIRGRAGAAEDARVCPNCGGERGEGQTAICEYCGGRIVTGEFPWILSRIEQDESYGG